MTEAVAAAAGIGVGAELARAREERGLDLADVAQQLKFAPRQLEALERERFELLPGGTFVRGMIRNYARLLKIEAEPLLARLGGNQRLEAPDSDSLAQRYKQPVPFSDGARRSTFVYLGVSLGVMVIVGGLAWQWYREPARHPSAAAKKPATPQPQVAAVESAPAPVPAPKPALARVQSEKPAALEKTVAPAPAPAPAKTAGVPAGAPAVAVPSEREKTIASRPLVPGIHRIVMRCEGEAWLEVKDANGRNLLSSLYPAGCERVVQGRGPCQVVIGNASHVRVLHNDRELDLQPHTKQDIARFTIP